MFCGFLPQSCFAAGNRGETSLICKFNYDRSCAVPSMCQVLLLDSGETLSKILDLINLAVVVLCVLQHFKAPHYSFPFLNLFWLRIRIN